MAAQSNVNLESVLLKCLYGVEAEPTQDRWKHWCAHLLLKYSVIFADTAKSNASFESVKTLRLFFRTHNNNEMLHFCEIMKSSRCSFCHLGIFSYLSFCF